MELNKKQQQQIISHVRLSGHPTCQVCKNDQWTVLPMLTEVRPYAGGTLMAGGAVVPLVMLSCNHCHQVIFFPAMSLGILAAPESS